MLISKTYSMNNYLAAIENLDYSVHKDFFDIRKSPFLIRNNLKSESVETVIPCMVTYKVPLLPYPIPGG